MLSLFQLGSSHSLTRCLLSGISTWWFTTQESEPSMQRNAQQRTQLILASWWSVCRVGGGSKVMSQVYAVFLVYIVNFKDKEGGSNVEFLTGGLHYLYAE